jgi:hypothetical protein
MISDNIITSVSEINGEFWANIELSGNLTQILVPEISDSFIDLLNKNNNIDVKVDNMTGIDLAFIQLLHSLKKTANELSKQVIFDIKLSDDIKSIVNDAGFNNKLSL